MYSAEGKYSKNANKAAFVKEGKNKPFVKEGDDEPLVKDGDWAGYNNEPLATKGIRAVYAVQGNDEPLATMGDWATTFNNCAGPKVLVIKSSVPIVIPHHCNEVP